MLTAAQAVETRDLTGDSRGRIPVSPQARLRRDIVLILYSDTQSRVLLSIARERTLEGGMPVDGTAEQGKKDWMCMHHAAEVREQTESQHGMIPNIHERPLHASRNNCSGL